MSETKIRPWNTELWADKISDLRAMTSQVAGHSVFLQSNGSFYRNKGIVSGSVDDGFSSILTSAGYNWTRYNDKIYASSYGFTGVGDESALWLLFCYEKCDKVVDLPIYVASQALLYPGTSIEGSGTGSVNVTADIVNTQSGAENHCLVVSDGCLVRFLSFDGSESFYPAGLVIQRDASATIYGCRFTNTSTIAIKMHYSAQCFISSNFIKGARHGVSFWRCKDILIKDNIISHISHPTRNNGGGIWGAVSENVIIQGNLVSHCADVGIDIEGGNNCYSLYNKVSYCRNGELAIFATGSEEELQNSGVVMGYIGHIGNIVTRSSYAENRSGVAVDNNLTDVAAEVVYGGLDAVQNGPILFKDNEINIIASTGNSLYCHRSRTSPAEGTAKILMVGCRYRSVAGRAITVLDRQDREILGCKFDLTGSTLLAAHELRDLRTFTMRDTEFIVPSVSSPPAQLFLINNSGAVTVSILKVIGGSYSGPGTLVWFSVQQNFTARSVMFDNLDFGDVSDRTVFPITRQSGRIIWKNQKIRLLRPAGEALNLAGVTALMNSSFESVNNHVMLLSDGKGRTMYRFALKCDYADTMYMSAIDAGGAVSTGIFPHTQMYATFASNTITFTSTGTSVMSAIVELNLESY